MKKLILMLLLATGSANGQSRVYFDSAWAVTTQNNAVYYRETEPKGNLTLIKDFYKNGTIQMEGTASNATLGEEVYEGRVNWYYPTGKLQSYSYYKNGIPNGESKYYDEQGRISTEFVYDKDGAYNGNAYTYKDFAQDIFYNQLTVYKNSKTVRAILYDNDVNGIKTETDYKDDFYTTESRYYDANGKLIGTSRFDDNQKHTENSVSAEYYYNPMRVASITKYGKNDETKEQKTFFLNGKLKSEYKANGNNATTVYYNLSGAKIGELTHKRVKDEYGISENGFSMMPQSGKEFTYFPDNNSDVVSEEVLYDKGNMVYDRKFRDNGSLNSNTEYVMYEGSPIISKITYYDEKGATKSVVDYKDGEAYNGIAYEQDREAEYRNGVLLWEKVFDESAQLKLERKNINETTAEVNIYGPDKKLKYHYTVNTGDDSYSFSGTVDSFIDGRKNTAVVKDGIITSGKITVRDISTNLVYEMERSGKWIIKRMFNEANKVVKETKEDASTGDYIVENRFYEELISYF